MKLLYLDCFAGISGDMFLGAMLDLGLPEDRLRTELAKLGLDGYHLAVRRVQKQHITATKFDCEDDHQAAHRQGHEHPHDTSPGHGSHQHHRAYRDIVELIARSRLSPAVQARATAIFRRLGEAEAKIHGIPLDQVQFHEVGALDSIVDIVGAAIALDWLGADAVHAAPPPLGSGFVDTAHGRFPLPAPATLELLRGVPTQPTTIRAELVTPTGAALLAVCATQFGPLPALTVQQIGYGAGTRDLEGTPNVLRAVVGEMTAATSSTSTNGEADEIAVIETNLDDMNPELVGEVTERLLASGALDAYVTGVQMKKNRPGMLITVLARSEDADRLAAVLLRHTTSFGVRISSARRRMLAREIVEVATAYGPIAVKIGRLGHDIVTRAPEYEACKRAAARGNVPVKAVYEAAQRAAAEHKESP